LESKTTGLLAQTSLGSEGGEIAALVLLIFLAVVLAVVVLMIASLWKVFTKAGQPGWGIFVPIYNMYLMLKVADRPAWWLILLFIPPVNIVVGVVLALDITKNFGKRPAFGVGLLLLPFIFYPILAFGDARYLPTGTEPPWPVSQPSLREPVRSGAESAVVVETRNLSKVYRDFWGRQKVRALKALDLEVRRGEIFGLLGPNGSGKTTTIKLILGLLFPTNGEALVFGRDATDVTKNERIGYLPEESYLYRFLNAEETLDFYGRLFNIPRAVRRQRVADLIEMVGLDWAKRRQLKEYSKGMVRRIGLAQALINDPELLVLDEPTTGMDPIGTREMKDLILKLRDEGKTILMCSHLLADVQDVCDRIGILYQGELKEMGRVDSLLKIRDVTEVRAAGLNALAQEEIRQVIERHNGHLLAMGNPTTTLEELFLKIIKESEEHPGRRVRGVQ